MLRKGYSSGSEFDAVSQIHELIEGVGQGVDDDAHYLVRDFAW